MPNPLTFNERDMGWAITGRKTQTCRTVFPQPTEHHGPWPYWSNGGYRLAEWLGPACPQTFVSRHLPCHYGKVGDALPILEPHWLWTDRDGNYQIIYAADDSRRSFDKEKAAASGFLCGKVDYSRAKRQPMYQPHFTARYFARIEHIYPSMLGALDRDAVYREGLEVPRRRNHTRVLEAYWRETLSRTRYGDECWDTELWVWVIRFKIEPVDFP